MSRRDGKNVAPERVEVRIATGDAEVTRGYQPPATGGPEGHNPPTGGSNVVSAPSASGNDKD
jgi:hypothetical protein